MKRRKAKHKYLLGKWTRKSTSRDRSTMRRLKEKTKCLKRFKQENHGIRDLIPFKVPKLGGLKRNKLEKTVMKKTIDK